MSDRFEDIQSRRQFFVSILRYASLGLLSAAAASVFAKRCRLMRDGRCINNGLCTGCEIFDECDLPRVLSQKQDLRE